MIEDLNKTPIPKRASFEKNAGLAESSAQGLMTAELFMKFEETIEASNLSPMNKGIVKSTVAPAWNSAIERVNSSEQAQREEIQKRERESQGGTE